MASTPTSAAPIAVTRHAVSPPTVSALKTRPYIARVAPLCSTPSANSRRDWTVSYRRP